MSINILCPKPSTLLVKCLTVARVAVMSSVAERESLPKYTLMSYVYRFIAEFVNFEAETFSFLWNVLPEDNLSLEFSISLIQLVKDSP